EIDQRDVVVGPVLGPLAHDGGRVDGTFSRRIDPRPVGRAAMNAKRARIEKRLAAMVAALEAELAVFHILEPDRVRSRPLKIGRSLARHRALPSFAISARTIGALGRCRNR